MWNKNRIDKYNNFSLKLNYKKSSYFILIFICLIAIYYLASSSFSRMTIPTNPINNHSFIMTKKVFDSMISNQSVAKYLKNSPIYLIGGTKVTGYKIIPTADFKDETLLAANINKLPRGTKAILYDDEAWSYTPLTQQQNPVHYYKLAGQLAHSRGLKLLATPALDLIKVLNPTAKGNNQQINSYLKDNLAYKIAKYADVYEIQSQRLIQNKSLFNKLIAQASRQAKNSNQHVTVIAGISTCAGSPSSSQMAQAIKDTSTKVNGWWLNIPGHSPSSPNCQYSPSIAINSLASL